MKRFTLIIALSVLLQSCLILPIPNRRVENFGASGQVVDAQTGQPICGARIIHQNLDGEVHLLHSNQFGEFETEAEHQWHGGYIFQVFASQPIWPTTINTKEKYLLIEATGYQALYLHVEQATGNGCCAFVPKHPPFWGLESSQYIPLALTNDESFKLREVRLQRDSASYPASPTKLQRFYRMYSPQRSSVEEAPQRLIP